MPTNPVELVREYLLAMGRRDTEQAATYLSVDLLLVFPQGRFDGLEQLTAALADRYRSLNKTHHTWDVSDLDPETSVVVTTGDLDGINCHGVAFSRIRFCDRFVVRHELIVEQHVWNDLAESGVLLQHP
ncbi:MAG: nuclear transport factor 2 family protein [Acidimicrobiia bacterium]